MADFELEQLKTLFENLADRLDETGGDLGNRDELKSIKDTLNRMARQVAKSDNPARDKRDTREFIKDFFDEWDRRVPPVSLDGDYSLGGRVHSNTANSQSGGSQSIIDEELENFSDQTRYAADTIVDFGKSSHYGRSAMDGFKHGLGKASGILTSFTAAITGIVNGSVGWAKKQSDAYRDIVSSAEGSVGSIMDMRNMAHGAGMEIGDLAKAMKEGGDGVRLMGGKDFVKFNKAVRDATLNTGLMGMNFDQMVKAQGEYADILKGMGDLRETDADKMATNFQKLISINQDMAGIMGKTREDQLKAIKDESLDSSFMTKLEADGLDDDQKDELMAFMSGLAPAAKKMFKEAYVGGNVYSDESAGMIAMGGEENLALFQKALELRENPKSIGEGFARQNMQEYQEGAKRSNEDKDHLNFMAMHANRGNAAAAGINESRIFALSQNFDKEKPDQSKTDDQFTQGMLKIEEAQKRISAAMGAAVDSFLGPMSEQYGPAFNDSMDGVIDATDAVAGFASGLQKHESTMVALGTSALALYGAFKLLLTPMGLVSKLFTNFGGKAAGKILGGAAGGAARGAAGAAGSAGGSILGNLMRGAGGAGKSIISTLGGGAGSTATRGAGSLIKGLARGGLGIGAILESIDYFTGDKDLSFKNLAKSGLALGGGAIGGILGSAAGPVGTVAGGAGGYMAGKALGDWLLGPDDIADATKAAADKATPADASKMPNAESMKSQDASQKLTSQSEQEKRRNAAQANFVPKENGPRTIDQMNAKLLEVQERSANYLKQIKENTNTQLDLMREEIAMMRTNYDRTIRLLEEGNRNTREIQGLA